MGMLREMNSPAHSRGPLIKSRERSSDAAAVQLLNISKSFGSVTAIQDVSLCAKEGEFVSFLGPSGCGKTTLLRIIAGLEDPTSGTVCIRGKDVNRLPPYLRDIGMVFQQYALFPHKTVQKNMELGLRYRAGLSRQERLPLVREALALVRMKGYENRKPNQLSGGEQQRIALARSLVTRPALLLLDEPLSNLDAKLRAEMRVELTRIQRAVGITFIYVTHDQEEAMSMSDRVVVMRAGRIQQMGRPRDVYERPDSEHVARFMGYSNILEATVEGADGGTAAVRVKGGSVLRALAPDGLRAGTQAGLVVRREAVRITPGAQAGAPGSLRGTVEGVLYQGSELGVSVHLTNGDTVHARMPNCDPLPLEPGQQVGVSFALSGTWVVPKEAEGAG